MKNGLEKTSRQAKTRPASLTQRECKSDTALDSALQRRIDHSVAMQRQRKQIDKSFGATVQRETEEEDLLQGKFDGPLQKTPEEEELLQGKFNQPLQRLPEEEEPLQGKLPQPLQREQEAAAPNQTGMPDNLKQGIESLSGLDMSGLRVHYGSPKPAQLNAHAYAQGSDIHLGPGQEQHLPHEAWHVVQQQQGRVQPTTEMGGEKINDDATLEREADVMGARALNTKN
jgi:hypothetical protein